MTQTKVQRLATVEWLTGVIVVLVVLVAWVQGRDALAGNLTIFEIFPVFGLLAFVLMWTHFTLGSVQRLMGIEQKAHSAYWKASSGLVLFLLIAHPVLVNFGLFRDGLGLPPASYQTAYGSEWLFVLLGSAALTVFLAFEFHRWFSDRSWWRYVDGVQVFAMAAIFVHALMLGQELTISWFRVVWWLLGISLIASVVYNRVYDAKKGGS